MAIGGAYEGQIVALCDADGFAIEIDAGQIEAGVFDGVEEVDISIELVAKGGGCWEKGVGRDDGGVAGAGLS